MYCISCGAGLTEGASFCVSCGQAVDAAPADDGLGGPRLLDPPIEFAAIVRSPVDQPRAGVLVIFTDGLIFTVDARAAQADPFGQMSFGWRWADVARVDLAYTGSSRMRFFGNGRPAHVIVTSTSGSITTLEISYDSYVAVEEAAFCIAAATDTHVTLDGVGIRSEEGADELERMLDDQRSSPAPALHPAASYPLPPHPPAYPVPAYGPGYPVPAYGPGFAYPAASTNGLAVASLICAFFVSPLGLALGLVAKSQIRRTGEGGSGLATAGIVISSIFIGLSIAAWIAIGYVTGAL